MVACASTLHPNNIQIKVAKDAALALKPLAGGLASQVFAFGLFVASVFSATILPLATAFYVSEAFGFEAGIDKKWNEAKEFYIALYRYTDYFSTYNSYSECSSYSDFNLVAGLKRYTFTRCACLYDSVNQQ